MKKQILPIIGGTRPEIIKLLPLVKELDKSEIIQPFLIDTGQHKDITKNLYNFFEREPDFQIKLKRKDSKLSTLTISLLGELNKIIEKLPESQYALVQGDTQTTLAATQVAYWNHKKIIHLEAGLRSKNLYSPFPEEINRRMVSQVAHLHFSPTSLDVNNLISENISKESIHLVGNTAIDGFVYALEKISNKDSSKKFCGDYQEITKLLEQYKDKKIVTLTTHRRESWGKGIDSIIKAVEMLIKKHESVVIIIPMHPNKMLQTKFEKINSISSRVILTQSLSYEAKVLLLKNSFLLLTDSGGLQEEAPSLPLPVVVLREETERLDGIKNNNAILAGLNFQNIYNIADNLIVDEAKWVKMANSDNPYGDGKSCLKIAKIIEKMVIND